jgi:hypothetical protein
MTPDAAFAAARPGDSVIGWKLDCDGRERLLVQFPPRYASVVADHVTLRAEVAADSVLPEPAEAQIVGHADDGQGVEAMVVAISGSARRPDGGIYHVTWSLAPDRRAKESNDVIGMHGWAELPDAITIKLIPQLFP